MEAIVAEVLSLSLSLSHMYNKIMVVMDGLLSPASPTEWGDITGTCVITPPCVSAWGRARASFIAVTRLLVRVFSERTHWTPPTEKNINKKSNGGSKKKKTPVYIFIFFFTYAYLYIKNNSTRTRRFYLLKSTLGRITNCVIPCLNK